MNEERKSKTLQGTRDFNVENPCNTQGKNHGRQPAKLHYFGGVYKRRGCTMMRQNPSGGLQGIYIDGGNDPYRGGLPPPAPPAGVPVGHDVWANF
jgi:hypothetical protein